MTVAPIPPGYAGVTPYLIVRDALRAIDFYKQAFGATEALRLLYPDGRVAHAELAIGQGFVMLAEEMDAMGYRGPHSLGGTLVDPFGHVWSIATHQEDVSAAEMARRMQAMTSTGGGAS
jgi:PhnB protein